MANAIEQLDAQVAALFSEWSIVTTFLAVAIIGFILHPLVFPAEPDTHPLLLVRQASAGTIRYKGESASLRSPETPHGFPLRTGLNVKEPDAPRWATGKDGDLRDVWREVQKGGTTLPDGKTVPKSTITTVLGKEEIVEHNIEELSKEIGIIGKQFTSLKVQRVAIYLPNSIEYLQVIFACSFCGVTPILLPYNLPFAKAYELVRTTKADGLVCSAGALPLDDVAKECPQLRSLVWVVEKSSRHMDWNGVPDAAQGRLAVHVWHDVLAENRANAIADLPPNGTGLPPQNVVTVTQSGDPDYASEIVELTQANLVAAIAALMTAIPLRQRLVPSDLVLPAGSFTENYVLCQTFAALIAHCSLVINSVASPGVDLTLAVRKVSPTVIIASTESLLKLHQYATNAGASGLQQLGKYLQARSFAAGRMPSKSSLLGIAAPFSLASQLGGKLRLILTSERQGASAPTLTTSILSDLRIYTRSRIVYALTAPAVAGAIAQTNIFDYRDLGSAPHFGIPLSSVELKLVNDTEAEIDGREPQGQLVISGPAVSGEGVARLTKKFKVRNDFTIAYA